VPNSPGITGMRARATPTQAKTGILPPSAFIERITTEGEDMAAYCLCCGAEISLKAEACSVCGTPRHGMMRPDPESTEETGAQHSRPQARPEFSRELRKETHRPGGIAGQESQESQ
jgi:hypothetical protein